MAVSSVHSAGSWPSGPGPNWGVISSERGPPNSYGAPRASPMAEPMMQPTARPSRLSALGPDAGSIARNDAGKATFAGASANRGAT